MKRFRLKWPVALLSVCGLLASMPSGARGDANVDALLEQVPADAWGFVLIPSLSKMNDGVNAVQTAVMGAPMMDALSMMSMQMGIEKGLDKKGGAIVFFMDMKKYEGKGVAGVLTTTDPKSFLENFTSSGDEDEDEGGDDAAEGEKKEKPAKKETGPDADGLYTCEIGGEEMFALIKGKHVTMTPNKELAKVIAKSTKSMASTINASRKAMYSERTISVSAALARVATVYQDEINNMAKMAASAMGPEGAGIGASVDEAMQVVRQLETVDLGLQLDKSGFQLTGLATPKAGTELEEDMKAAPKASGSLLKGLPGPSYILALGAKGDKKSKGKDIQKGIEQLLGNPSTKDKVDAEQLKKIGAEAEKLQSLVSDMALSVSLLPEGPHGVLALNIVVESNDSAKLMEGMVNMIGLLKKLPTDPEEKKKIEGVVTHKAAAETVGNTKVDHLIIDPSKADEDAGDFIGIAKKIVGPDGLTLRMGAPDSQHLIVSLGGGKDQFAALAKSAQSGDTSIASDAGITKASNALPKNRRMEMYLSVDSVLKAINRIARVMEEDAPLPSEIKPIGAPVSMVMSIDGTTGRFDVVVPMEVVTGVKNAFMEGQSSGKKKAKASKDGDNGDSDKGDGDNGNKKDKDNGDDDDDDSQPE